MLIGPSASYVRHKGDEATTASMGRDLLREAQELLPALSARDITTSYSGIRPKTVTSAVGGFGDFIPEEASELPGMLHLIGIESPGLTAAPAIAEDVAAWAAGHLAFTTSQSFVPERKRSVRFRELPVEQQARLIEEDPDYGRIVCRCEIVTRKEILQAIRNPLNVRTITGIKYRCRAMMGRCQGGFCSPRVVEMLEEELEDSLAEVTLKGPGSELFAGTTKGLRR